LEAILNWVFGIHAVHTLLKSSPQRITELQVQRGRDDTRLQKLLHLAKQQGIQVNWSTSKQLDALVTGRHQGIVAHCTEGVIHNEEYLMQLVDQQEQSGLFLILDGVTDPHNLGACLRSADAAGVQALVVPKDNSVGLTPVVHKVASGAAETVPLVAVTNLVRTLQKLQQKGVWIVGTSGDASKTLYEIDLTGPLAIVMGSEGRGMRQLTRNQCDYLCKLPMAGEVTSLNISVAAGICLFEAVRQRN
jgi:23S rRNA (guanosine2251-2'-O)-methyltransferase